MPLLKTKTSLQFLPLEKNISVLISVVIYMNVFTFNLFQLILPLICVYFITFLFVLYAYFISECLIIYYTNKVTLPNNVSKQALLRSQ